MGDVEFVAEVYLLDQIRTELDGFVQSFVSYCCQNPDLIMTATLPLFHPLFSKVPIIP